MVYHVGTQHRPLRVAIIGAGPSGFYAAGALLDQQEFQVLVDIFDRLPTPFGLVRDGVAPDHQKIKSVTKVYDRIASDPRVRFFGNVTFGVHLTNADFHEHYDQIVYAVGAPSDRQLGIPGEELEGSHAATAFVGWYNGHPDYTDLDFDLSVESAAVVGNGNVAMDVARLLARSPEELAKTDISEHALARLRESRIKRIYVLGRRGPVQAAFTNPEIRELGDIEDVAVIVLPNDLVLDEHSLAAMQEDKVAQKNMDTLSQYAGQGARGQGREIHMRFLVSPVELMGENGRLTAIRLQHNRLTPDSRGYLRAEGIDSFETVETGLVFRAIGYKGVALPDVPYDARSGRIPNVEGRVIDPERNELISGEYVVGWAKRGPTGIIGTNKPDAVETVRHMLSDVTCMPPVPWDHADPHAILDLLAERQPEYVTYSDWRLLDDLEISRGKESGRPRAKFCRVEDMLAIIRERRGEGMLAGD